MLYQLQNLTFSSLAVSLRTTSFNLLSTKLYLSDLQTHSYCAVNTICFGFKTVKLMLYTEIIDVCSEIHTKHINALWAEHRISEC